MCKIFNTLKNISVIPSSQYMYQSETQKKHQATLHKLLEI